MERVIELIGKNEQNRDTIARFNLADIPRTTAEYVEAVPRADYAHSDGNIRVGQHRNLAGLLAADHPLSAVLVAADIIADLDRNQHFPDELVGRTKSALVDSEPLREGTTWTSGRDENGIPFFGLDGTTFRVLGPYKSKGDMARDFFGVQHPVMRPRFPVDGWEDAIDWERVADTFMATERVLDVTFPSGGETPFWRVFEDSALEKDILAYHG